MCVLVSVCACVCVRGGCSVVRCACVRVWWVGKVEWQQLRPCRKRAASPHSQSPRASISVSESLRAREASAHLYTTVSARASLLTRSLSALTASL